MSGSHDSTLTWDADDKLQLSWTNGNSCGYLSKPKRKGGQGLNMNHIWIDLVSKKTYEE
jgi:hypothetical protein